MTDCYLYLILARKLLKAHKAQKALSILKKALALCPVRDCKCSAKILFYIGLALKHLGFWGKALTVWISAYKFKKNNLIRKMIQRYANGYGMLKQPSNELDDKYAFFSIQINRYLSKKHSRNFSTIAEKDMILDLIEDYWKKIKSQNLLLNKNLEQKRALFLKITIPFPYFCMPASLNDSIIEVNFSNEKQLNSAKRCFCGSGLPFLMCCGRSQPLEEYLAVKY